VHRSTFANGPSLAVSSRAFANLPED
jgi:hypothetical protein